MIWHEFITWTSQSRIKYMYNNLCNKNFYTIILLFCILADQKFRINLITLGHPYPIFNYLIIAFMVAIHKVIITLYLVKFLGSTSLLKLDPSEVKSLFWRKKKCMHMFHCAPMFFVWTWNLNFPRSFGIVFEHVS